MQTVSAAWVNFIKNKQIIFCKILPIKKILCKTSHFQMVYGLGHKHTEASMLTSQLFQQLASALKLVLSHMITNANSQTNWRIT